MREPIFAFELEESLLPFQLDNPLFALESRLEPLTSLNYTLNAVLNTKTFIYNPTPTAYSVGVRGGYIRREPILANESEESR